jgi:GT2 family glycosyltransferase
MTISVVIATHNRRDLLDECLAHLAGQSYLPGDEVIVVDNGSTDDSREVITGRARTFPVPLRYLEENEPGKSRAVAAAVRVATGDVLAFTDDDVNVEPSWLEAIRRAMTDPAVTLIGGPVSPRWERRAPAWLARAADGYGRLTAPLALLNFGSDAVDLGPRTALGANLAVRRDVFLSVGSFAPHLGKLRGTLMTGEDHELCRRVQAAGFRAVYCPDMQVRHWVPADRTRIRYCVSWFFWSGIANAAMDAEQPQSGRSLLGIPLYLVKRGAAATIGVVTAAVVGNATGAIERAVDVAFAAGYAARRWGLPVSRPAAMRSAGGAS